MDKLLQNKVLLAALALVLIIVVGAGGYYFLSQTRGSDSGSGDEQEEVLTLSAEEIGLSLEMGEDGKEVIMRVEKVDDITSIEYELSYTSEGDIPRGAIGSVEVSGKPVEKKITLGTCSDVCHYDEDVSDIKIILKVTKTDGKVYQVEKSLEN
jgi:hypothetical protein